MAFITEQEILSFSAMNAAQAMIGAAKTAPKGRGMDSLVYAVADESELKTIAQKMKEIGEREEMPIFTRDADNLLASECVVLIGTKIELTGLKFCGLCGFKNCNERVSHNKKIPCVFNITNLGIAIGSAVGVAADRRIDNRVMYTIGMAVKELGLMTNAEVIYGIPLSIGAKNIYFDRKQ